MEKSPTSFLFFICSARFLLLDFQVFQFQIVNLTTTYQTIYIATNFLEMVNWLYLYVGWWCVSLVLQKNSNMNYFWQIISINSQIINDTWLFLFSQIKFWSRLKLWNMTEKKKIFNKNPRSTLGRISVIKFKSMNHGW